MFFTAHSTADNVKWPLVTMHEGSQRKHLYGKSTQGT